MNDPTEVKPEHAFAGGVVTPQLCVACNKPQADHIQKKPKHENVTIDNGTVYSEPLTPDSAKEDRFKLTAVKGGEKTLTVALSEDAAYNLGVRLLAWCQLREAAREK